MKVVSVFMQVTSNWTTEEMWLEPVPLQLEHIATNRSRNHKCRW